MSMVTAQTRRALCVEMAAQGRPFQEIAEAAGYRNRSSAWRVVSRALTERVDEAVADYRAIELARLDALQDAVWDSAMTGDTRAVDSVLKVMNRRAKLLGLDQIELTDGSPKGVVLSPDELAAWAAKGN